jgi:hypothetical protein
VDPELLQPDEGGIEERLGAPEPLAVDRDDLAVGQLVVRLELGGALRPDDLRLEVDGDVAELLLDVAYDLGFGVGREGVAARSET